jgi:hypothetical protein
MTLHKITEIHTELISVCLNITSEFRTIAIFKIFAKENNHSNKTCRNAYDLTVPHFVLHQLHVLDFDWSLALAALYPRGNNPRYPLVGREWVGLRTVLEAETRRKLLCPCRESNIGCPVRSRTYWATPFPSDGMKESRPIAKYGQTLVTWCSH